MNPPLTSTLGLARREAAAAARKAVPDRPPVPETLHQAGLSAETVGELALKTLYVQGARTGQQLCNEIRLPFRLIDEQLLTLQQRQLVEVRGASGSGRGAYTFDLTGKGRVRAREAIDTNQYVGPAPVPLTHYRLWVERQTIRQMHATLPDIQRGLSHLVLLPEFIEQLGPAINSAKSMFLYGDSGNGKTNLSESIARMIGGAMYLPHAVDVSGHVVVIHDPVYHRPAVEEAPVQAAEDDPDWLEAAPGYDLRYARVQRPVVFTGGELTLEQLDLQYDASSKVYQAPFQMKANGGILIIDDFGRQRVRPRDLLNRWIVPLEKRVDFLTLHTGHKFPVPFDCLLIFATNLDPNDLVDEAFLRRIHYKILVPDPTREQYEQIFRRCCVARRIPYRADRVEYVYRNYYERIGIQPRSCHPRDLIDHLCDAARFTGVEPDLSEELLDRACRSYFLDMPGPVGEFERAAGWESETAPGPAPRSTEEPQERPSADMDEEPVAERALEADDPASTEAEGEDAPRARDDS